MFCRSLSINIVLWVFLFFLCGKMGYATPKEIEGLRVWSSPDSTRVVFDLSEKVEYKVFTLENPNRIVIDFTDANFSAKFDQISLVDTGISQIRHSLKEKGQLRIVLDMQNAVKPSSFLMSPNQTYGHRLVVDLALDMPKNSIAAAIPETPAVKTPAPTAVADLGHYVTRDFIVAIDAGHGGEDTGAIGHNHHLKEKDVVFNVSKKLQALINAQPGMKAFLVRTGDYYIGLRKRMTIAREQGADLFISVHADSFNDPRAKGASVFVLSEKGASNEAARWLAERENSSDLIGGVSLDDKSNILASVLLDLSQTATKSASHELASQLIGNLEKVTDIHHKSVQHAGFMVLKSPDIPSVLVELGFLSNHQGEEKLLNAIHQQALAKALFTGVKAFIAKRPAPVTQPQNWTVARKHQVKAGESLAEIAKRYRVGMAQLKAANRLKSEKVRVGQQLTIPASAHS